MKQEQETELYASLRRLAEQCAEALATLHSDKDVDDQHFENVLDINRSVWSLRWELGLFPGDESPTPLVVACEPEVPDGKDGAA